MILFVCFLLDNINCRTGSFTSRRRRLKRSWRKRFLFLTTKDLNICWSSPMAMWRKARSQSEYSLTIWLFIPWHELSYCYSAVVHLYAWYEVNASDLVCTFAFEGFLPRDGCRRRLHVPDGPWHVLLSLRHMALPQIQVAFYRGSQDFVKARGVKNTPQCSSGKLIQS